MKVYGLNEQEIRAALDRANEGFDGNLRFNREPEKFGVRKVHYALTLRVKDSRGPGAKSGFHREHTVSADYYAHYAFMDEVFQANPEAKIISAMETYDGYDEFKEKAPGVAHRQVGSMMYPVSYGDM